MDDNYTTTYIQSTITSEQLSAMTGIVADKLAPCWSCPSGPADTEGLVVDTTRGGVMKTRAVPGRRPPTTSTAWRRGPRPSSPAWAWSGAIRPAD
ncbi:MAG: hypothetical protein ACLRWQ_24040 [Flavonifractor plautii]